MKYIKSIVASLAVAALVSSCGDPSDFGTINDTPNNPTKSFTYMLFKYACLNTRNNIMTSSSYDPWEMEWTGYLAEAKNNQYGPLGVTYDLSMGGYYTGCIKNLTKIIELNQDEETKGTVAVTKFGSNANQIAASITLRSYYYMHLTDIQGPIVYSEALGGLNKDDQNFTPKYDKQQDVYAGLDKELADAYKMFDTSSNLSDDDILLGGDIKKWKKFNASLRMLLAIKLADVDPNTGKTRFAAAFADGGMESADESLTYTFDESAANAWFYAIGNYDLGGARSNYFAPNKVFIDALKEYKDPRLFTYATVGANADSDKTNFAYLGTVGTDNYDFDQYFGMRHGLESNEAVADEKKGKCSTNAKYCKKTATYGLITAARVLLVEAEAATLGWINADAAALYAKGIQASFDFEAMSDPKFSADQAEAYIAAHPLPTTKDEALHEIVMQRFLAGFLTDGVESWSDWRRYNIPTLPMEQGQIDEGHDRYPQRLAIYSNDYATNADQVQAALSDIQGPDDPWSRVWWDVKDNESPLGEGVKK